MHDILFINPPHPEIKNVVYPYKNIYMRKISQFDDVLFTRAENHDELLKSFHSMINRLKQEQYDIKCALISYLITNIEESMFQFLLTSNLLDCVTSVLLFQRLDDTQKEIFDIQFHLFLNRCIKPFMKFLNDEQIFAFEKALINLNFEKCQNLLQAIFISVRLTQWVSNPYRSPQSLQIFLKSLKKVLSKSLLIFQQYSRDLMNFENYHKFKNFNTILKNPENDDYKNYDCSLPNLLAVEISRCLVISVFLFDSFSSYDLSKVRSNLISCITTLLMLSPSSFGNSSTIECLHKIRTSKKLAIPLIDSNEHPNRVPLISILQLIRLSLFSIHNYDQFILLDIASVSPASQSTVLMFHPKLYELDKKQHFFNRCLSIDSAAKYIKFGKTPKDLIELAIFLRSPELTPAHLNVLTKDLNKIVFIVYNSVKRLHRSTTDARILIASAKIISFFISFTDIDLIHNPTAQLPRTYVYISEKICDSIVSSPLFSLIPNSKPISFLLLSAFEELADSLALHPFSFLSVITNTNPTPGRVLLLSYVIKSKNFEKLVFIWKEMIKFNLGKIISFGLSILKVPSVITCNIAADFFIALVEIACRYQIPQDNIFQLCQTPLLMLNNLVIRLLELDPIHNSISMINFLCFLHRLISKSKIMKSFILLTGGIKFNEKLISLIKSDISAISGKLSAKAIQIIAAVSDYNNTLQPKVLAAQRLIFDVPHHYWIRDWIHELNQTSECEFLPKHERGIFALAATELLIAWSEPPPLAAFVSKNLNTDFVHKIENFAKDAGNPFDYAVFKMLGKVKEKYAVAEAEENQDDLINTQLKFQSQNACKTLQGMFFKIISNSFTKNED
ncbi:hypothetical protein TRFO_37645 [Tritrichomonas foetus]|uniref:Uncharacterized protein n=1 Tax=Tritrichomonas foetus TaxID=1144522 RepID=A0A1J4JD75_9EUKA|nr:hypothetical protein TRFO_37645 [Tritrichomonas foetus]|eukprot:OHS96231.1 hypothetical protein TRFO_37645 [Tritrichomonas foetus]